MYPVSYANTHYEVTDLVYTGWLKIQELEF